MARKLHHQSRAKEFRSTMVRPDPRATGFWNGVEATRSGILLGHGEVASPDESGSRSLLRPLVSQSGAKSARVLDVGAGIGRVSANVLRHFFSTVDLLEPCLHFLEEAKNSVRDQLGFAYLGAMETFAFQHRYDCIWIQWCTGHVSDDEFVSFLRRAGAALSPGGFVIVKENNTYAVTRRADPVLGLVTRSDRLLRRLFSRTSLHISSSKRHDEFGGRFLPVTSYVLIKP